jgi:hypothetical protein
LSNGGPHFKVPVAPTVFGFRPSRKASWHLRIARAQYLLDSEFLAEPFLRFKDSCTAAWRATTIDDVGAREKLFLAINIVDHLTAIVTNGKLAQAELKELAQTAESRSRFGIA